MKITKTGAIPQAETKTTTCGYCRTEFEFTRNDVVKYNFHMDEGTRSTWAEVNCPLCRRRMCVQKIGWMP